MGRHNIEWQNRDSRSSGSLVTLASHIIDNYAVTLEKS
jgi:hypothetical protein